jgi:hypothetical protein
MFGAFLHNERRGRWLSFLIGKLEAPVSIFGPKPTILTEDFRDISQCHEVSIEVLP